MVQAYFSLCDIEHPAIFKDQLGNWQMKNRITSICILMLTTIIPTGSFAASGTGGGAVTLPVTPPPNALPAISAPVQPPVDIGQWVCTGNCGSSGASGDIGLPSFDGLSGKYGYLSTRNDISDTANFGLSPFDTGDKQLVTNGSRLVSPSFQALAGYTVDIWFNYITSDGKAFSDYAWARLINQDSGASTYLFLARAGKQGAGKVIPGAVLPGSQFNPAVSIVDYKNWNFQTTDVVLWEPLGPDGQGGTCFTAGTCGNTGWVDARASFASTAAYRLELGVTNIGDSIFDSGLAFAFSGMQASTVPEPTERLLLLGGLLAFLGRRLFGRAQPVRH